MYKKSLFIFRRDIRLNDNIGLIAAHRDSEQVFPVFIFDPVQCSNKNRYKSDHALQFLIESLFDLEEQIQSKNGKLSILYGDMHTKLQEIIQKNNIEAVYCNYDYTPFARVRDQKIEQLCDKLGIGFHAYHDALLTVPGEILNGSGKPYKVFSSFYKKCLQQDIAKPVDFRSWKFAASYVSSDRMTKTEIKKLVAVWNDDVIVQGGRKEALKRLKYATSLESYDEDRNIPSKKGTSLLSAYHKFGNLSARESFHAIAKTLGRSSSLNSEIFWRDFFTHIAYHFPHVFKGAFREQYDRMQWNKSKKLFDLWCQGKTGFPIVDAGMRELNKTGFMHNRVRMIVASFLVKDLHISWRWGEQYFARTLVDYDPSVNNGNWQWVAGTGCDAAPYFRVFNPWLQQKKFDPECLYIKKWVPELQKVPVKMIHNYFKENEQPLAGYVLPIVDHAVVSKQVKELYNV